MASRSFKPASYLASAAQPKPSRTHRPSFVRNSSASSTSSNKSDEGFMATLRSLNVRDASPAGGAARRVHGHSHSHSRHNSNGGAGGGDERVTGTSTTASVLGNNGGTLISKSKTEDTPQTERTKPIAIELPARNLPTTYTPLTGRGDLKGGYFPGFEESPPPKYRPHPFITGLSSKVPPSSEEVTTPGSPSNMSACSFTSSPATDSTPRVPTSGLTAPTTNVYPRVPDLDAFTIPKGKYYPSNYITPMTSQSSTPRTSLTPVATSLQIPAYNNTNNKKRPSHERNNSDVKRKLQQYQRDMIAQARAASHAPPSDITWTVPRPVSPRLAPLGSPGPITPLELENNDGYLAAGSRHLIDNNERNLVENFIGVERRRMNART
ncbi:hypothetical protein HYALB_00012184 [Hymenoscyphus albidus]|uniref:Uncharacterized protein n=1 Tax=Hymenoscyphus albidus TaxID=595503 RepID=A0A9N9Q533_9HELO|nr:hypothetical protein HYALB_00012184 [Hymenoscyphus albidus]